MSKEFQRIKERNDVQKQLTEFLAQSIPRAVKKTLSMIFFSCLLSRLDISID